MTTKLNFIRCDEGVRVAIVGRRAGRSGRPYYFTYVYGYIPTGKSPQNVWRDHGHASTDSAAQR